MQLVIRDFRSLGVKLGALRVFAVTRMLMIKNQEFHIIINKPNKLQNAVARISRVNLFEQFRTLSNSGLTIGFSFIPGMYSFRSKVDPEKALRAA